MSNFVTPRLFVNFKNSQILCKTHDCTLVVESYYKLLLNSMFSLADHASIMNTQRFAAVIMRIRDPKTTALIFASGKMVSVVDSSVL